VIDLWQLQTVDVSNDLEAVESLNLKMDSVLMGYFICSNKKGILDSNNSYKAFGMQ
jgi:hypothetical protein